MPTIFFSIIHLPFLYFLHYLRSIHKSSISNAIRTFYGILKQTRLYVNICLFYVYRHIQLHYTFHIVSLYS